MIRQKSDYISMFSFFFYLSEKDLELVKVVGVLFYILSQLTLIIYSIIRVNWLMVC